MSEHRCACVAIDRYDCWAHRYNLYSHEVWELREMVDADGGPCECLCHYEDEEI